MGRIVPHAELVRVAHDGAVEMGRHEVGRAGVLAAGGQHRLLASGRVGEIEAEVAPQRQSLVIDSQQDRLPLDPQARSGKEKAVVRCGAPGGSHAGRQEGCRPHRAPGERRFHRARERGVSDGSPGLRRWDPSAGLRHLSLCSTSQAPITGRTTVVEIGSGAVAGTEMVRPWAPRSRASGALEASARR